MYSQIATFAFIGIEARPIEVQVRISGGAQAFAVVGLPDKAVAESRERVRNALHAIGLGLPFKHITVNLAPADLPKEGSHFDLPIALAMMVAMGAIAPDAIDGYAAIGELALTARSGPCRARCRPPSAPTPWEKASSAPPPPVPRPPGLPRTWPSWQRRICFLSSITSKGCRFWGDRSRI